MKKVLLLFIITTFISCETTTIEVEKSAGMTYNGVNKGKSFMIGSDENAKIAVDAILAYADGNFDYMNEVSSDTVMFFEPSMGKPVAVINPANEFLTQIQSPYDSISRLVWNAIPLKRDGDDFETVLVSFIESRYKDGNVEKLRVLDKIFIRDGKFFRVNQWNGIID
tara:strand:- start:403 stop:903 length:501 start_codon:yes stop_codon:yes gene_type:complete